jgi:hypothetical protein
MCSNYKEQINQMKLFLLVSAEKTEYLFKVMENEWNAIYFWFYNETIILFLWFVSFCGDLKAIHIEAFSA